jgi:hypothetical protein
MNKNQLKLWKDIDFIKNDLVNNIKLLYNIKNFDFYKDKSIISNIFRITYNEILLYFKLIPDYQIKLDFIKRIKYIDINFIKQVNNLDIKTISEYDLNTCCSYVVTDMIYLDIFVYLKNKKYNSLTLSFN